MIVHFRHKGLELLYEKGNRRRLPHSHVPKIKRILAHLDEATGIRNMDLPGFRLHALKGDLAGYWSVRASGNWRILFRLQGVQVTGVDLVDYH